MFYTYFLQVSKRCLKRAVRMALIGSCVQRSAPNLCRELGGLATGSAHRLRRCNLHLSHCVVNPGTACSLRAGSSLPPATLSRPRTIERAICMFAHACTLCADFDLDILRRRRDHHCDCSCHRVRLLSARPARSQKKVLPEHRILLKYRRLKGKAKISVCERDINT